VSTVGVEDGTVEVGSMNINVGVDVAVGDGVFEGNIVTVGVKVGGIINAVWVAAASAVNPMAVLIEFGSKVGTGTGAGTRVGAQASTSAVMIKKENIL
jgi:hypothetical protein